MGFKKALKKAKKASNSVAKVSSLVSKVGKPMAQYGDALPPPIGNVVTFVGQDIVVANKAIQKANDLVQMSTPKPVTLPSGKVVNIPQSNGSSKGLFGLGNLFGFL